MTTRRTVIAGAGALVLAGLGYRAWDRGVFAGSDGDAYVPWREWGGAASDGIKRPLRAAILAANPHDTQPWLFTTTNDSIFVFADRARNLGAFDPFRREMHLGLGASIENFVLSARAYGFAAEVVPAEGRLRLSPSDTPVLAATVKLTRASPSHDKLYDAIPLRHTNRGPYRPDETIAPSTLRALADMAGNADTQIVFFPPGAAHRRFGALVVQATSDIISDPVMAADSARWFRTGAREVEAHRDGISMDTSGLSSFMVAASKMLPDLDAATSDRYWLNMTRDTHVGTAPMFGMILVRDRLDMKSAISAGRAWQRLHLAATLEGIAAQPLNQPVECVDRAAMLKKPDNYSPTLAALAAANGWEPTFTFRLGFAEHQAGPSPRRKLEDVVAARVGFISEPRA